MPPLKLWDRPVAYVIPFNLADPLHLEDRGYTLHEGRAASRISHLISSPAATAHGRGDARGLQTRPGGTVNSSTKLSAALLE
jgi:hypothetical protein